MPTLHSPLLFITHVPARLAHGMALLAARPRMACGRQRHYTAHVGCGSQVQVTTQQAAGPAGCKARVARVMKLPVHCRGQSRAG